MSLQDRPDGPASRGDDAGKVRRRGSGARFTNLDQWLLTLIEKVPGWRSLMSAEDIWLVEHRLTGAALRELADETKLTQAGVRARLYGEGHGRIRRGGVIGQLNRTLKRRHRA